MKKMLKVAGIGLIMMASGVAQAATKIAVVDMGQVFQQSPQREQVSQQLQSEFKPRADELQALEKEFNDMMAKGQRDEALMSETEKQELRNQLASKQQELQMKGQAFQEDNARRQNEETNKLLSKIEVAIKAIAAEEKIDLVLDRQAALFMSPDLDISEKVIERVAKQN